MATLGERLKLVGGKTKWVNAVVPPDAARRVADELELGGAAAHVVERQATAARAERNGTGRPW